MAGVIWQIDGWHDGPERHARIDPSVAVAGYFLPDLTQSKYAASCYARFAVGGMPIAIIYLAVAVLSMESILMKYLVMGTVVPPYSTVTCSLLHACMADYRHDGSLV
jgi:hypothetical protein